MKVRAAWELPCMNTREKLQTCTWYVVNAHEYLAFTGNHALSVITGRLDIDRCLSATTCSRWHTQCC